MSDVVVFSERFPIGRSDDGRLVYPDAGFIEALRTLEARSQSPAALFVTDALAAAASTYETRRKVLIFYADAAPTAGVTDGDVWLDTNDSLAGYRRLSGAWTLSASDALVLAVRAVNGAQLAGVTLQALFEPSAPTATTVGDLWYAGGLTRYWYRWDGARWVAGDESHVVQAGGINRQGTQATADFQRGLSYVGTPKNFSWWADTSTGVLKVWIAGVWETVAMIAGDFVSASLTPTVVTGSRLGVGTVTTTSTTVTASGGTAPYAYSWSSVSGDVFTATSPTSATSTFSISVGVGETKTGRMQCVISDAAGRVALVQVTCTADETS